MLPGLPELAPHHGSCPGRVAVRAPRAVAGLVVRMNRGTARDCPGATLMRAVAGMVLLHRRIIEWFIPPAGSRRRDAQPACRRPDRQAAVHQGGDLAAVSQLDLLRQHQVRPAAGYVHPGPGLSVKRCFRPARARLTTRRKRCRDDRNIGRRHSQPTERCTGNPPSTIGPGRRELLAQPPEHRSWDGPRLRPARPSAVCLNHLSTTMNSSGVANTGGTPDPAHCRPPMAEPRCRMTGSARRNLRSPASQWSRRSIRRVCVRVRRTSRPHSVIGGIRP